MNIKYDLKANIQKSEREIKIAWLTEITIKYQNLTESV